VRDEATLPSASSGRNRASAQSARSPTCSTVSPDAGRRPGSPRRAIDPTGPLCLDLLRVRPHNPVVPFHRFGSGSGRSGRELRVRSPAPRTSERGNDVQLGTAVRATSPQPPFRVSGRPSGQYAGRHGSILSRRADQDQVSHTHIGGCRRAGNGRP